MFGSAGGRRRKLAWFGAVLVALGLPAGWYFGEGGARWREVIELRAMCAGTVDSAALRELYGRPEQVRGHVESPGAERLTRCWATGPDPDGSTWIAVSWGDSGARLALDRMGWERSTQWSFNPVVPLGSGWSGVLTPGKYRPMVVVALPCTGAAAGKHLVVSVELAGFELEASTTGEPFDSPAQRARTGRLVTGVAERASDQWGCGAAPGNRIEDVVGPSSRVAREAATPDGSCAGVGGRVDEVPADAYAPLEECETLLPWKGGRYGLTLSAAYPPFAGAMRSFVGAGAAGPGSSGQLRWATAACSGGEALYLVRETAPGSAVTARDALAGFARESAKRHGCAEPVLP
ncbi:hypothetical protein [Kitasatospora sp. NPDC057198]|uniref:hypothetical protein n=1 Tax=Kitasatospora sp. NPDC057198 TaxID=3346046 RepID=UPI00363151B1